ncbi:GAF domain-containing protein [Herbihabitans rhizosphaerae]|uniref:GAF domain-containing protein n=1 Tax=Herbihabitans rhizosphaerae TaxID=1872711 RepID=A0A4Q7KIP5_9PSEU|nr:GAF and ANTAR domain-containing protein [Herbihabitans rhizosphaerae]RZS32778.1 GAF domain-containing protein [Herbihabitans rhizosphaerae]
MTTAAAHDRRVAEILSLITDTEDDRPLLVRLCAQGLTALPVAGVALALMTDEGPSGVVLAATDDRARKLEELQFSLGEGPCVEASRNGRAVLEPDLGSSGPTRWPAFGAAVLEAGVRAIFAFPLRVGAIRVGILDLYRDVPGWLSAEDLAEALAFADAATVVVLYLQADSGAGLAPAALTEPIDNRAQVHQATGMITIQLDVEMAEALLRLRAHAYATSRTVSEVAVDVVDRRIRFDDSDTGASGDP